MKWVEHLLKKKICKAGILRIFYWSDSACGFKCAACGHPAALEQNT